MNEKRKNINAKLRIEKTDQFTPREGTQVTIIKYCPTPVTAHQACSAAIHSDCCYSTFYRRCNSVTSRVTADLPGLISSSHAAVLANKSMLLTRSSGYTVLCSYRSGGTSLLSRDARGSSSLRSVSPLSDSIGVACNRLLIQPCPAALCVSLYLTIGQIIGPLQETSSVSAPYRTRPACLAAATAAHEFTLPEKFSHLRSHFLPNNLLSVFFLSDCDRLQFKQALLRSTIKSWCL